MKPENAIEVHEVTKSFKIYLDKGSTLKEKLLFKKRRKYENRTVLRGLNLEIKRGAAIGLIGHNGCGKSTTLKLLTKIMYPDSGKIEMRGRVSSLIELGAGFHPDMSGRENIYTNASIFGLTRKEINRRIESIISFSELENFIDNPVRTYSSGMYMRLAFSIAINVDADILLIDEIIAVGDANFQSKCFDKLREIKENGTTIVIVSHSLGQIEQICETSYWIDQGVIRLSGNPREVHLAYLSEMGKKRQETRNKEALQNKVEEQAIDDRKDMAEEKLSQPMEKDKRFGSRKVEIAKIEILDSDRKVNNLIESDCPFSIRINYRSVAPGIEAVFGFAIYNNEKIKCSGTNMQIESGKGILAKSSGIVEVFIKNNNLNAGDYQLHLAIYTNDNFPLDDFFHAAMFTVVSKKNNVGICNLASEFKVIE